MSHGIELGAFDCPSGVLVLLDPGLAHHWERRGIPAHRREPRYDLAVEGADARKAGLAYDRSYDPLRRFDLRDPERAIEHFAEFTRSEGLDAHAVVLPARVPHAERARRCLTARRPGLGSFPYDACSSAYPRLGPSWTSHAPRLAPGRPSDLSSPP